MAFDRLNYCSSTSSSLGYECRSCICRSVEISEVLGLSSLELDAQQ